MQVTSELKFTDVNVDMTRYNMNYYKDNYVVPHTKGFTEHLACAGTRYNPVFYFYRGDNIIGISLAYYGEYTENELGLLRNFMDPTTVVYDIGANIGFHTTGLAKTAKHVYAFEPNKKNFQLLDMNTFHDTNVTLIEGAASDVEGVALISDFVLGETGNFGECKLSDTGQECCTVPIDKLVDEKQIEPPHLVKIDVEGHEWNVIQGMQKTIREHLPVIFYEHMHGDGLPYVYDFLTNLAYEIYWFPCPNYNPNNYYKNNENIFGNSGVLNALAIPFHLNTKIDLPKMLGRDDTWGKVLERLQNKNA